MTIVLRYFFVFMFCSTAGWLLELVYRTIKSKKLINPGFLTGCCLPIYGFGGCAMFLLCSADLSFIGNEFLRVAFLTGIAIVVMTAIEFVAGYASLKFYNVRLWDYSKRRFNYKGIICPLFSAVWGAICLAYYFLLYPFLSEVSSMLSGNFYYGMFTGFYFGVFAVDLVTSLNLMAKLKAYAVTIKQKIDLESFKLKVAEEREKAKKKKDAFMLKIHNEIRKYIDVYKIKGPFGKDYKE